MHIVGSAVIRSVADAPVSFRSLRVGNATGTLGSIVKSYCIHAPATIMLALEDHC